MWNETQICDIWSLFADYIDKKAIEAAAELYVEYLIDNNVTATTLEHALGNDSHLDHAIANYLDNEDNDDQEEFDF